MYLLIGEINVSFDKKIVRVSALLQHVVYTPFVEEWRVV